ncbi:TPA: hypothetical protein ACH3X1_010821 [Trebouxia sp. C0004]
MLHNTASTVYASAIVERGHACMHTRTHMTQVKGKGLQAGKEWGMRVERGRFEGTGLGQGAGQGQWQGPCQRKCMGRAQRKGNDRAQGKRKGQGKYNGRN